MKQKIALSLFVLLAQAGWAQSTQSFRLKDCIDYGLQHYGTVRIAQNQVENANQQARQALGLYLPQVSATGTLTDNVKLQKSVIPAGVFGPEPQVFIIGQKYQTNVTAQASQTIYDRSLLLGIKAAKPNQRLADLNTRQTREDIIYNIASNYYQVFVAQQQIALLRDNLERTQQVLNILKLQRDNGVIQPVDYTRTEVSYNSTQSQLTLAENDYSLALNRLKYQMGLPQEQELTLSDSTLLTQLPVIEQLPFESQNLVSFQQSATNLDLQRLQLERIRAGYIPTVSLTANYGTVNLGAQTIDKLFTNFVGFGSIALRFSIPIFDGFQRDAQIKQQRLTVLNQEEQQRLNVAAYRLQFNNAQSQIQRAQTNVLNGDRNVKLAQEVYNITTLQYKQGVKSLTDLVNADTSYRQAQSDYINSLINLYQARLDLEQSKGTLLTFYNQL
ncbi:MULTISPECIES: TolC family protein [unclassified Spirosoma]|uniref:TolC family protein n=1 Tax=unclassified Spirosoma TaxID=2621999 RepID=UPI0009645D2A|nr:MULTISPECIES: TolC family protein [unclassified Spirosoma]MBN8821410.1 TolC family protein [Spirosoma sp.]OJW78194.1 MAG: transporter [Spirosoma sp. 48-14]